MIALAQAELLKLRSTRTFLGFLAASVLLVLTFVLLSILAGDPSTISDKRDAIGFAGVLGVVLLVFGVVGATGEYRHRTLAPALLVAPDRARLTASRIVAYGVGAAVIGLAMAAVSLLVGLPLLSGRSGADLATSDVASVVLGGLLSVILLAMLGVCVGVLVRNQVGAVVGILVYFFIVEPLLSLLGDDVVKFSIGSSSAAVAGQSGADTLSFGAGVAALVAWTVAFFVAAVLVDRRRDVV